MIHLKCKCGAEIKIDLPITGGEREESKLWQDRHDGCLAATPDTEPCSCINCRYIDAPPFQKQPCLNCHQASNWAPRL